MAESISVVKLSEGEYASLSVKDPGTLYIITGEGTARAAVGSVELAANAATSSLMASIMSQTASYADNAATSATSALAAQTASGAAASSASISATSALERKEEAAQAASSAVAANNDVIELKAQTQEIYENTLSIAASYKVGPAFGYGVTQSGNVVSVTWTDPSSTVYASWGSTRLVAKLGGYPADETDGETVVETTVRNAHQTTPATFDTGGVSGYCFALFTCTTIGTWNTDESCPRFTADALTWATIAMMTRTNTLLGNRGIAIGSAIDIQTNSQWPGLRWMLVDVNYTGAYSTCHEFHADGQGEFNSIWVPQYLPCHGANNSNAEMMQFDAPEMSYAETWDESFVQGKAYYVMDGDAYTQLAAGTDYTVNTSVREWSSSHGKAVYTKNHNSRASNGNNLWIESNMRWWLQASGAEWWSKKNEYDVLSGNNAFATGWLTGFDESFLAMVKPVRNVTARNTTAVIS